MNTNEHFRHLGRDEVDVLNACTKAELSMEESEVELDECQAIQTLNQRSEARGKAEGKLL